MNLEEVDDDQMDSGGRCWRPTGVRHRALRKFIQGGFPRGPLARKYEDFLRGLTSSHPGRAFQHGEFDFVEDVGADFPIRVLARLLDVPAATPACSSPGATG